MTPGTPGGGPHLDPNPDPNPNPNPNSNPTPTLTLTLTQVTPEWLAAHVKAAITSPCSHDFADKTCREVVKPEP